MMQGKTAQARSGVGWFIVVFRFWCTYHWTQWKVLVGAKNCMLGSHPY